MSLLKNKRDLIEQIRFKSEIKDYYDSHWYEYYSFNENYEYEDYSSCGCPDCLGFYNNYEYINGCFINMESFLSINDKRDIKINQILGISQFPSFGDIWHKR